MGTEPEWTTDQVIEALTWKRQQLADHEAEWKKLRQHSRDLTMRLITEHGMSVNRAADISGHHRNTIAIWLKIHNAETKGARKNG
jgi:hypothetical protein